MFNFRLKFASNKENLANDFELIKQIYSDSIEIIEDDLEMNERLIFKINLKREYHIDNAMAEIVKEFKFNELFISSDQLGLPWRVQFTYVEGDLDMECYIFWLKKKPYHFENFNIDVNEDSFFFGALEQIKEKLPEPEKNVILNWLQDMKEKSVITCESIYTLYDKSNFFE
jgi:hypothetical protein